MQQRVEPDEQQWGVDSSKKLTRLKTRQNRVAVALSCLESLPVSEQGLWHIYAPSRASVYSDRYKVIYRGYP